MRPLQHIYRPATWESLQADKTGHALALTCQIDGRDIQFPVHGEWRDVPDAILLAQDDNLIAQTSWSNQGYTIAPFLPPETYSDLINGIQRHLHALIQQLDPAVFETLGPLPLHAYHRYADLSPDLHTQLLEILFNGIPMAHLPIDKKTVAQHISVLCGQPVSTQSPTLDELFMVRLVRPGSQDNNLPHRDVWLDAYRNSLNIYVPLAGSNALSALPLIPGSHLWPESKVEALFAGQFFTPMTRINPEPNQVLVFSPYLIHGGAFNWNDDLTRASLEMRFWRKV